MVIIIIIYFVISSYNISMLVLLVELFLSQRSEIIMFYILPGAKSTHTINFEVLRLIDSFNALGFILTIYRIGTKRADRINV